MDLVFVFSKLGFRSSLKKTDNRTEQKFRFLFRLLQFDSVVSCNFFEKNRTEPTDARPLQNSGPNKYLLLIIISSILFYFIFLKNRGGKKQNLFHELIIIFSLFMSLVFG